MQEKKINYTHAHAQTLLSEYIIWESLFVELHSIPPFTRKRKKQPIECEWTK